MQRPNHRLAWTNPLAPPLPLSYFNSLPWFFFILLSNLWYSHSHTKPLENQDSNLLHWISLIHSYLLSYLIHLAWIWLSATRTLGLEGVVRHRVELDDNYHMNRFIINLMFTTYQIYQRLMNQNHSTNKSSTPKPKAKFSTT